MPIVAAEVPASFRTWLLTVLPVEIHELLAAILNGAQPPSYPSNTVSQTHNDPANTNPIVQALVRPKDKSTPITAYRTQFTKRARAKCSMVSGSDGPYAAVAIIKMEEGQSASDAACRSSGVLSKTTATESKKSPITRPTAEPTRTKRNRLTMSLSKPPLDVVEEHPGEQWVIHVDTCCPQSFADEVHAIMGV